MTVLACVPARRDAADLVAFDIARALAALAVLLSHARSFVLLDAADEPSLSLTGRAFMAISGLGHQAVIVFFVVSGALVTRSLLLLETAGRLSVARFAVPRLTRLWVVLLPCLALGGLLDHVGFETAADAVHYGVLRLSAPGDPPVLDAPTFVGNLAFLQTIAVPTFGTNGPLWSLANEAWYYLAAFLAFVAGGRQRRPAQRVAGLVGLSVLALGIMTATLWLYLPVWCLGAALAPVLGMPAGRRKVWTGRAALVGFVLALAGSRLMVGRWPATGDYALACATAAVLWAFADRRSGPGFAARFTRGVARMSFSLYLSHLPMLAFVAAVAFGGHRVPIGPQGLMRLGGVLTLSLAWAGLLWWAFERHTGAVRRWVERIGEGATQRSWSSARTADEAAS